MDALKVAAELEYIYFCDKVTDWILSEEATMFLSQWLDHGENLALPIEEDAQKIWKHLIKACPIKSSEREKMALFRGCSRLNNNRIESYSPDPDAIVGFAGEDGYVISMYVDFSRVAVFDFTGFCAKLFEHPDLDAKLRNYIEMYRGEEEYMMQTDVSQSCLFRYVKHPPA